MSNYIIKDIFAQQVLDSRGLPTIQVYVKLVNGVTGSAMVPSGASTGKYEAHELRDGDNTQYFGKGVTKAVNNINTTIKHAVVGKQVGNQKQIDNLLITLDNTPNKTNLGANAMLAVSLACARACANAKGIELYEYLHSLTNTELTLPVPMCNILNGGAHASNNIDIQEFMIMPVGASSFSEGIRWCAEIFNTLKQLLKQNNLSIAVGDEGGFAPDLKNAEQALDLIMKAIKKAGYNTDTQIKLTLDPACSDWAEQDGTYLLPKAQIKYTKDELINYWADLCSKYPIISLEDALSEDDYSAWSKLTAKLGEKVQIVGDDLFVTNQARLNKGIKEKQANSILIKLNQIGTLTETLETIKLAQKNNFTTVISHRSGETEDTFIADLAVATNSTQIKTGSLCRSERVCKYNRLLTIEATSSKKINFLGKKCFNNLK